MADIGLSDAYRAMSLVGFNVGIEVGQALFLSAVLAIALVLRRVGAERLTDPRVPSAVAAVCGSVGRYSGCLACRLRATQTVSRF